MKSAHYECFLFSGNLAYLNRPRNSIGGVDSKEINYLHKKGQAKRGLFDGMIVCQLHIGRRI